MEDTQKVKDVKLIIGVLSCRKFRNRRNYIRQSWGQNCTKHGIDVYFIVGRPGEPERIEGDRIIVDAGDYYEDLPMKVFRFTQFCLQNLEFDYLFKTDDDVFIKFPKFLKTTLPSDYGGHLVGRKTMSGTWHQGKCHNPQLNKSKYKGQFLGKWCGGPGYFLSHQAATQLVAAGNEIDGAKLKDELYEDKMVGDLLRSKGIFGVELEKYYRNIHRWTDLKEMPRECTVIHLDIPDKGNGILESCFQHLQARKFPVKITRKK